MNRVIAIIVMMFFFQFGSAQTYKFKTTGFSVSQKKKSGEWTAWTKTQPTELLINLDRSKNRFVVYSEIIQLYNIYKYEDKKETDKETTNRYFCVDNEGLDTVITIVAPKDGSSRKQIYIANEEMMIEYDLVYLGENK
ncbi:hypothetical protein [Flavobacterium indicum]|nr:hypothetical protein [Flavobacterium indicum]